MGGLALTDINTSIITTHVQRIKNIIENKYQPWANLYIYIYIYILVWIDITEKSPYSFGNYRKLSLYNCFMLI